MLREEYPLPRPSICQNLGCESRRGRIKPRIIEIGKRQDPDVWTRQKFVRKWRCEYCGYEWET